MTTTPKNKGRNLNINPRLTFYNKTLSFKAHDDRSIRSGVIGTTEFQTNKQTNKQTNIHTNKQTTFFSATNPLASLNAQPTISVVKSYFTKLSYSNNFR